MTAPKRHLPNQIVEITRRTSQRRYFLRPSEEARNLIGYMYAKAVTDHDQEACVVTCMSNHIHCLQVDLGGTRSKFMQQVFSNVSRKMNILLRRRENLWSSQPPGDMTLLDIQAIQEKVVYVCVQAVVARCVKHARDWTGFKIGPSDWGRTLRFTRPPGCGDSMPEVVVVKPKPPPGFRHQPLEEVIKFFQDLIAAVEKKTAAMHGARVLGVTYCESISPFSCPNTPAPTRTLNPRFSGRNKVHVAKALEHQRQFRHEHRIARAFFRKEQRDVVFPYGTIQMAAISGVCCAAPLLDDPHLARLQWSEITHKQWDDWKASQLRVA